MAANNLFLEIVKQAVFRRAPVSSISYYGRFVQCLWPLRFHQFAVPFHPPPAALVKCLALRSAFFLRKFLTIRLEFLGCGGHTAAQSSDETAPPYYAIVNDRFRVIVSHGH